MLTLTVAANSELLANPWQTLYGTSDLGSVLGTAGAGNLQETGFTAAVEVPKGIFLRSASQQFCYPALFDSSCLVVSASLAGDHEFFRSYSGCWRRKA